MASSGAGYNAGTAHVNIKPKLDQFAKELKAKLAGVKVDHKIDVKADTTGLAADIRAALATIPDSHDVRINVKANTEQIRKDIDSLSRSRSAELDLSLNTAAAEQELNRLTRDREVRINAEVDDSNVGNQVRRVTQSIGRNRARIRVDADTSGANQALAALGGRMRGLDRYQRHVALTGTGFTLLGVAIAGAVGPLASFTGQLISAAGVLATLPALLGGAVAGIAALMTGMSGIGTAFGAMGKAASGGGAATEKAMASAQRAVERAQRGITMAERGVRDASEGVEDAYRRVEKAEKGVADAQDRSRRAQDGLNRARKTATRELRDMNEQLMDAALTEEDAVLAVARARKDLEETLADSDSDDLDIRQADLDYRKSLDALQDVRRENNRLAEAVSEANAAGVEGSDQVVEAHQEIADAQEAEQDAAQELQDAHRGLRNSYEQLADAEYQLGEAHKDLAEAMASLDDAAAGGGGVDAFAEAMANLSEEAQKFVLAIRDLGPAWKDLRLASQDALFKDLGVAMTTLADKQLPVLKDGFVDINTEMNSGIRASLRKFSTEIAAVDFRTFLQNTAGLFQGLALAAAPLSQIWIDLATVGSEYLPRMGGAVAGAFGNWSQSIAGARADGSLNEMIDNGIASFSRLASFVGDVGGTIAGVFRAAATAGDPFFFRVEQAFTKIHEWSDSIEGQNALKDFFHEAAQAVDQAMPVLVSIGGFLTGTLMPIVESLVTGLSPGLSQAIDQISETLLLGESAFQVLGEAAGGMLSVFANVLESMEPVHSAVFGLAEVFLGLPDPILLTVAAFVAFKKLKLLDLIKSTRKGFGNLTLEMEAQRVQADRMGQSLGALGGYWRALETRSPVFTRMGDAFRDSTEKLKKLNVQYLAADTFMGRAGVRAQEFGAVMQGVGKAGLTGFRAGLDGIMDIFGGPWGAAFAAGTAVITAAIDAYKRGQEAQEQMAKTGEMVKDSQLELAEAVAGTTGALGTDGLAAAAKVSEAHLNDFMALAGQLEGAFINSSQGIEEFWEKTTGSEIVQPEDLAIAKGLIKSAYKTIEKAARDAGVPMDEINTVIAEGGPRFKELRDNIDETSLHGETALKVLDQNREVVENMVKAYQNASPEVLAVNSAFEILSDTATTVDEKLEAVLAVMQHLGLAPKDAERAYVEASQALEGMADQAVEAADKTGLLGEALFENGRLKLEPGNAQELFTTMDTIHDKFYQAAAGGADLQKLMADDIEPELARLAEAFGLGAGEVEFLRQQFGLMPETVTALFELEGMEGAERDFYKAQVMLAGAAAGTPVKIPMQMLNDDAIASLEAFGVEIEKNADGVSYDMTLNDEGAQERLNWWIQEGFPAIDWAHPSATLNLDDTGFLLKHEAAMMHLATIDQSRPNPLATMDISKLAEEQIKALEAVGLLDESGAVVDADMNIEDLNDEQKLALAKVFNLDAEDPTPHADMDTGKFHENLTDAEKAARTLEGTTFKPKLDINLDGLQKNLKKAWDWLTSFAKGQDDVMAGKDAEFKMESISGETINGAGYQSTAAMATGGQYGRHAGYRLPTHGPGTEMVDGFMALDATGMPAARLDAGEWVINGRRSNEFNQTLGAINSGDRGQIVDAMRNDIGRLDGYATGGLFGGLPGFAGGGIIQGPVDTANTTARQWQMWDIIRANFPDAELSSTKRHGGGGDYHDQGYAIDLGGGWANDLQAIANWIALRFPHSSELFWDPGPNIKNGKPTGPIGGHSDHVHWAMVNPPIPAGVTDIDKPRASFQPGTVEGPGDYGLSEYDTTHAGESLTPLQDQREDGRGNPNNVEYTLDGDELPTTWSGIAGNFAKLWAEGTTRDVLGLVGMDDELPAAFRAYQMYQQAKGTVGTRVSRERAEQTLANGGTDKYFSEYADNLAEQGQTISGGTVTVGINPMDDISVHYPEGDDPVERWRPLARQALARHGYNPDDHIEAMMQQIDIESSGDPNTFNYWDSNYLAGDPSGGLLQVIGSTYRLVRSKYPEAFQGLPDNRLFPLTNLTAGVGAVKNSWGGPGNRWPTRDGYALGGFVSGIGGPTSDLIPALLSDGEFVTRAMSTDVARPLLEAMNHDPGLAAHMNAQYLAGQGETEPAAPVEIHYHIETNNVDEGMRRAEMHGRRQLAAMAIR